jgi:hypothetical protein
LSALKGNLLNSLNAKNIFKEPVLVFLIVVVQMMKEYL